MKFLLATILSVPGAAATTGYVGPFTSFAGDKKCTSVPTDSSFHTEGAGATNYALNYNCDSLQVPSAWQKRVEPEESDAPPQFDFDLAIVGGGVGGAYLVSRLHEEFVLKRGQAMPKVALFERSDKMGGRLMSGYGAGALNLGVQPMSKQLYENPKPMPEYGGMRLDPLRYPLVTNRVVYMARILFGTGVCPMVDCNWTTTNCCEEILTRMEVGDVRYVTKDPAASALMASSTVGTTLKLPKPLKLSDIATSNRSYPSPFEQCLMLFVAADAYYNVTGKYDCSNPDLNVGCVYPHGTPNEQPPDRLWKTSIDDLCKDCKKAEGTGFGGMCALCRRFKNAHGKATEASAAVSCSGYDINLDISSLSSALDLAVEVTDITKSSNLYLTNVGYQRFTMGLLQGPDWTEGASPLVEQFKNRGTIVAPQYGKQLKSLSAVGTETSTKDLVEQQLQRLLHGSSKPSVKATGVTLNFADGSSATAKSAYLTMLPYDLAALDDFGGWAKEAFDDYLPAKGGAVKVVFGWSNISESLGAQLNLKSCDDGECQRLILDGPADSWLVRQVWLWDAQTIMVYETAPYEAEFDEPNYVPKYPSNRIAKMARTEGMDAMVKKCFNEIRKGTNLPHLKDPDWARLKVWPWGSLMDGWKATANDSETDNFVDHISRPLGDGVPLYYGNSEAARDGNNHGWVEGALEQAEEALAGLTVELGLEQPPFKKYHPGRYGSEYPDNYDPTNYSTLNAYASPGGDGGGGGTDHLVGLTTLVAAIVASFAIGTISVLAFQRFRGRGPVSSAGTLVEMQ